MNQRVRITTGARLHFGLLDVSPPFGGCGVMIDQPETIVEASISNKFELVAPSSTWEKHSPRVQAIAKRLSNAQGLPAVRLELIQTAPRHNGLGSGTQLSLAIAEAILRVSEADSEDRLRERLLMAADRGKRSAVGTYGYFDGGFIAEGLSAANGNGLNQVDCRLDVPGQWRVVALLPKASAEAVSGSNEQAKFERLTTSPHQRQSLATILINEMVPAIEANSFESFAVAVTRYNQASGMLFAPVQGGPYNGPETTRLIDSLVASGHQGVGQSSWGPGVFVWFEDKNSAEEFRQSLEDSHRSAWIMCPASSGRRLALLDG